MKEKWLLLSLIDFVFETGINGCIDGTCIYRC